MRGEEEKRSRSPLLASGNSGFSQFSPVWYWSDIGPVHSTGLRFKTMLPTTNYYTTFVIDLNISHVCCYSDDYRLFCGDLGNEVNDDVLSKSFVRFPSFNMARVCFYSVMLSNLLSFLLLSFFSFVGQVCNNMIGFHFLHMILLYYDLGCK